jgi:hypothetical protein
MNGWSATHPTIRHIGYNSGFKITGPPLLPGNTNESTRNELEPFSKY